MSYNIAIHMHISPIEFSHCQKCVCDIFFNYAELDFTTYKNANPNVTDCFDKFCTFYLCRSITDMYTVAVYTVVK